MVAFLLILAPGVLTLAGGVRLLFFTDLRAAQMVAVGALLTGIVVLPLALFGYGALSLIALGAGALAFLAGGWSQISMQPKLDHVPSPRPAALYSAKVALDDMMLGAMATLTPPATVTALRTAVREVDETYTFFAEMMYLDQPRRYHQAPPNVTQVNSSRSRVSGLDCDYVQFASGYDPDMRLPGGARWLAYKENQTCHAWVFRQPKPAPWLLCVHGFGMGNLKQDMPIFRVAHLYENLGLNVALMALPVHGPRSPGGFSGSRFFGSSPVDFIHAETQAIWDLRRLIAWLREQGAAQLGVYGISLGGYTSALLAGIEDNLDCVIAGVPPSDMIAHRDYLASSLERRTAAAAGVDSAREQLIYRVVSPLALDPLVPFEKRYLFGATGDQFVPIEQVQALWQHWGQPRIRWTTGGHVSALMQRDPKILVDEALVETFGLHTVTG